MRRNFRFGNAPILMDAEGARRGRSMDGDEMGWQGRKHPKVVCALARACRVSNNSNHGPPMLRFLCTYRYV